MVCGQDRGDGCSVYSDMWWQLTAADWYTVTVISLVQIMEEEGMSYDWGVQEDEGMNHVLYHGTTFYNLLGILSAGGFIPGENGHSKCKKYYTGAFGSSSLGEATMRADITRHGNPIRAFAMPVVLEMKACTLVRYHKHSKSVFVVPGEVDKLHPGVRIAKVHFRWSLVQNFWRLSFSDPERELQNRYGKEVLCGQGNPTFSGCGQVMSSDGRAVRDTEGNVATSCSPGPWFHRTRKGYYYCERCFAIVQGRSQKL